MSDKPPKWGGLTTVNSFFSCCVVVNCELAEMKLKIEFGGGLELLFLNQRTHLIDIPSTVPQGDKKGQPVDIDFLVHWLKDNLLKERPELFIENGTV
jgi:ubiquitin related modifier 1